jgi:hypothetical protein
MFLVPLMSFDKKEWISFPSLKKKKKKLDESSRLDIAEIARVAWHASFEPL